MRAGFKDEVWLAGSQTAGLLADALGEVASNTLKRPARPVPCRLPNGLWRWHVLLGWLCPRMGNCADTCATSSRRTRKRRLSNPQTTKSLSNWNSLTRSQHCCTPPRSTAPAIAPGVLIAVRLPYDTFCIARVEQQLPTAGECNSSRRTSSGCRDQRRADPWPSGFKLATKCSRSGKAARWTAAELRRLPSKATPLLVPMALRRSRDVGTLTYWGWTE